MASCCQNCSLCCAVARILCFRVCCPCFRKEHVQKEEINLVVLGQQNAGKSHMLTRLCDEDPNDIVSTKGFSIKDVALKNYILHCKELGGSDMIRQYWSHYYDEVDGVLFVIDGSAAPDLISSAIEILEDCMQDQKIAKKPLLVIVNRVDESEENSVRDIASKLELVDVIKRENCSVIYENFQCPSSAKVKLEEFVSCVKSVDS